MTATTEQTQRPVVVFVPGSFASVRLYDEFVETLTRHGVQAKVIDTPSVGRREGLPPQTMSDDVDEIVKVVSPLLDQGEKVVITTHSYGGIPGTQSLKHLSRVSREAAGKEGGVDKIVYLTSVVPPVDVSNFDAFGGNMPSSLIIEDDYMRLVHEEIAPRTFSDLPLDEAMKWARQMPEHSTASFKEKLTYPGYNDVEVHYIVCEEDKVILPEHQYGMIEFLKGFTGKPVVVHKLQAGHAPTHSQPDAVAKLFRDIAGGAGAS